ncbi:hypothetical protein [Pantoea septica]|uniref:hypothetical protein n=1 Tax=Pantoea septica TaxID=472695 RepID=UPI0028D91102|nr:hypothetical protein [Pantoea septica]
MKHQDKIDKPTNGNSTRRGRRADTVKGKHVAKPSGLNLSQGKSASAQSHSATFQLYKSVGLNQKKVYLGNDALAKLAVIFESQHGVSMDVEKIDPLLMGDVLSYCINFCYNLQNNPSKKIPDKINAAATPSGQLLYRFYQMARAHTYVGELVYAFNATNQRGRRFFPHLDDIADGLVLFESSEDDVSFQFQDDIEESNKGFWSTREIQALRDSDKINDHIARWNSDVLLSQARMVEENNSSVLAAHVNTEIKSNYQDDEDDDWDDGLPHEAMVIELRDTDEEIENLDFISEFEIGEDEKHEYEEFLKLLSNSNSALTRRSLRLKNEMELLLDKDKPLTTAQENELKTKKPSKDEK